MELHYLPFSVCLGSTLFAILSSLIRVSILSCLFKVHTIYHSQQFHQGLHCMPFSTACSGSTLFTILSSLIWVYTVCHSHQPESGSTLFAILSKQYSQVPHCLPFSAVWSGSTLLVILSSLIRAYTICQSKSDQGQYNLPFLAVWSGSTIFAILSKQYYQGLHCLPFSAVWSGSTLFVILSSLI